MVERNNEDSVKALDVTYTYNPTSNALLHAIFYVKFKI